MYRLTVPSVTNFAWTKQNPV